METFDKTILNNISWNSWLSTRYKLLYIGTPKVACTSLKRWFASLEGLSRELFESADSQESSLELVIHDAFYKVAPTVAGLTLEAITEPLKSPEYFRFAVVRNPYKRLFSAWQSKLLLQEPLQSSPYEDCAFFQYPIQNADDITDAFEGFVEHLTQKESPDFWDIHWTPQALLLRPDLISYSKLAQIENVNELSTALKAHLGPEVPDPFEISPVNKSLIPFLPEFISDRAAELIISLYDEDFKLFGYSYDKPETKVKFTSEQLDISLRAVGLIRDRHQRIGQISSNRDSQITALDESVAERDNRIAELDNKIAELDNKIVERDNKITERNNKIALITEAVFVRDRDIADLTNSLAVRDNELEKRSQVLIELEQKFAEKSRQLNDLLSSSSWRVTRPLRYLGDIIRRSINHTGDPVHGSRDALTADSLEDQKGAEYNRSSGVEADFDADFYRRTYPDTAGLDPYFHYSNYGKMEGRLPCAPSIAGTESLESLDSSRETVLIVSHEASRTGAPVLALNIARQLKEKNYNIIAFLLLGGSLLTDFEELCDVVIKPFPQAHNQAVTTLVLDKLISLAGVKFAVVNSILSRSVLPVLLKNSVPSLYLVHEFASYTFPKNAIREVVNLASQVVFSAPIVHEDNARQCGVLERRQAIILPQGKCEIPEFKDVEVDRDDEKKRLQKLFRPDSSPDGTIVILGAGFVQLRKGVDLFLACAARVIALRPQNSFRFVWVGGGFDADSDLGYSTYLQEQVDRSGLDDVVCFAGEIVDISLAYELSDVLFLSSRLDPLPNVAIDAMYQELPVLCFDKATGIADHLKENSFGDTCVVSYLNVEGMAQRLLELINDSEQRSALGRAMRKLAGRLFNITIYVDELERHAMECVALQSLENKECSLIEEDGAFDFEFYSPLGQPLSDYGEAIKTFVRQWRNGVELRKPFPEFHPGIYEECCADAHLIGENPLAAFIKAGKPEGPWLCEVIRPGRAELNRIRQSVRAALHIHVFFLDRLSTILQRLEGQNIRLDLLISASSWEIEEGAREATSSYGLGSVEIRSVHNLCHEIWPLLSDFRDTIQSSYDLIGHVHTNRGGVLIDSALKPSDWEFILENLLGINYPMASTIVYEMQEKEEIGLVFPGDNKISDWEGNRSSAEKLASQLGISIIKSDYIDFPVGGMFWAKTSAIKPLLDNTIDWGNLEVESAVSENADISVLGRLLPFMVKEMAYDPVITHVPGIKRDR